MNGVTERFFIGLAIFAVAGIGIVQFKVEEITTKAVTEQVRP